MKTAEECVEDRWAQVYMDELSRVVALEDSDDLNLGNMALAKVVEGVQREAAEGMREDSWRLCDPSRTMTEVRHAIRALPLPGDNP